VKIAIQSIIVVNVDQMKYIALSVKEIIIHRRDNVEDVKQLDIVFIVINLKENVQIANKIITQIFTELVHLVNLNTSV